MRVGPWLAPITKIGSPLTDHCQSRTVTSRNAGREASVVAAARRRPRPAPPRAPAAARRGATATTSGGRSTEIGTRSVVPRRVRSTGVVTSARAAPRLVDHVGDERDRRVRRDLAGVERDVEPELAARLGRLGAEHAEPRDPHRTGVAHPHRPPDAAGIPIGIEVVPVPEDAGDRALRGPVGLARARDLHREDVRRVAGVAGDLERVGEEVPLGRAEVVAVAPDVAEVEDAVEGQEPSVALGERGGLDRAAVQHRPVGVGEQRRLAPVAGDVDERPVVVAEVGVHEPAGQVAVVDVGPPPARQVDRGRVRRLDHRVRTLPTASRRRVGKGRHACGPSWLRRRSGPGRPGAEDPSVEQHELDHPQQPEGRRRWRSAGSPRAS